MPHTSCLQGRLTNFEKILQLIRMYIIEETRNSFRRGAEGLKGITSCKTFNLIYDGQINIEEATSTTNG
jgi:hypothetical protein